MLTEKYKLPLILRPQELFDNPETGERGLLRMSRTVFYDKVRAGEIAPPVETTNRYSVWSGTDIEKYLDKLLEKS